MVAPWPLLLYSRCRQYNALPESGGLLDQDEELMGLMTACADIYAVAKQGDAMKPGYMEWHDWLQPYEEKPAALRKLAERAAAEAAKERGG